MSARTIGERVATSPGMRKGMTALTSGGGRRTVT
jgi:hypothetical protein